jgi:hypothetical protein
VHEHARVHLRSGTDSEARMFALSGTQDRVRAMLQTELF